MPILLYHTHQHRNPTTGFYYGWFKNNVAGRDVCKGADFEVEMDGDIVTLKGTIKAVPPETAAVELGGDIQITPAAAYFQGACVRTYLLGFGGIRLSAPVG